MSSKEKILVLDFGNKYNQLLMRKVRELGVYSELKSSKISTEEIKEINPQGIILSGGPNKISDRHQLDEQIFSLGIPILGIGSGMQLIVESGNIKQSNQHTYVKVMAEVSDQSVLFKNIQKNQQV